MEREERIKFLLKKGYSVNLETGAVLNHKGKRVGTNSNGYLRTSFRYEGKKYNIALHQFVFYIGTGKCVELIDHKNGVKSDNRFLNLREATTQENAFNRINAKGYCFNKNKNKFQASIIVNGKYIALGDFVLEEEARIAYEKAKNDLHLIGNIDEHVNNLHKYKFSPKGISYSKAHEKYIVRMTIEGVQKYLGLYTTKEEAIEVYNKQRQMIESNIEKP